MGARELRVIVKRLRKEGKTILLTTHYMYEAEELCNRVLVLNHGRLVADGTPGSLKERYPAGVVVLEGLAFGLAEEALQPLRERPEVHSVDATVEGSTQRIIAQVDPAVAGPEAACDLLVSLGVTGIAQRPPTLEDAYVAIISGTSSAASDG